MHLDLVYCFTRFKTRASESKHQLVQLCILARRDLAATARRTAGEMQNTQQTYGAVDVAAAAPKKKLGRKVVVAIAALGRARCRFTDPRSSQNAVSLADLPILRAGLVGAALSLAPKTAGGVASLYGSTPNSLSGGTWSGNTSPQCMGARFSPWTCAAQCMGPSCWPGSNCATCCTCPGQGPATPPWQPAAPQTPKVACGPIIGQLKAVPPKGDAGIAYIQNTLMPICGVPSSGYPPPSAPVYHCPVCITRLAQAAANNDACAAATALVFGIAMDTDSSGGPGTAGGAQANGAGAQAKSLICGMTRGDGVTKAFAQCPGCPGQPLYKSVRYKDTEVPCAVCGNALPFTRFYVKDNKLVDNACKQCWK